MSSRLWIRKIEDFTYAIESYQKALQYDPTNTDANYKLAISTTAK